MCVSPRVITSCYPVPHTPMSLNVSVSLDMLITRLRVVTKGLPLTSIVIGFFCCDGTCTNSWILLCCCPGGAWAFCLARTSCAWIQTLERFLVGVFACTRSLPLLRHVHLLPASPRSYMAQARMLPRLG